MAAMRYLLSALLLGLLACPRSTAPQPCLATALQADIAVTWVDPRDLLIVVDDSPAMAAQAGALRARITTLLRRLVTGVDADGVVQAPGAQDLHVAVIPASAASRGFDAHVGLAVAGCEPSPPQVAAYLGTPFSPRATDPERFVDAVDCMVARALALWGGPPEPLASAALALEPGGLEGFLRSDPRQGLSSVHVLIVSGVDDCSVDDPAARPALAGDGASLRCVGSRSLADPVELAARLRATRAEHEYLVTLTVLGGLDTGLDALAAGIDLLDGRAREDYYAMLLAHPGSRPTTDAAMPTQLLPACVGDALRAEPMPRLLEAARAFGGEGRVGSLCGDSGAALFELADNDRYHGFDGVCMPHPRARAQDGRVDCSLLWMLPAPDAGLAGSPTACDEHPGLLESDRAPWRQGELCELQQLGVGSQAELDALPADSLGWYFDDFSDATDAQCTGPARQRAALTPAARPPTGVTVRLLCHDLRGPPGAAEDLSQCRAPAPARRPIHPAPTPPTDIGAACQPRHLPPRGYEGSESHVEAPHPDCALGVCLVHRLRGDADPACEPAPWVCDPAFDDDCAYPVPCADVEEVQRRIHCSCRCDSEGPDAQHCVCPAGFTCTPLLPDAPPALEGSYCVRDEPSR